MLSLVLFQFISIIDPQTTIEVTEPPEVLNQGFDIVSDLDDTLKITDIPDRGLSTVYHALFSKKVYVGLSALIQGLIHQQGWDSETRFMVISGSPQSKLFQHKITETLQKNSFPPFFLRLRNIATEKDLRAYKLKVLSQTVNRPVILLGDDTEQDPYSYDDFKKLRPHLVQATYIHRVTNRSVIQPGQRTWVTAFDIAYAEFQEKRLSWNDTMSIALDILSVEKSDYGSVIPVYATPGCASLPENSCGRTSDFAIEEACMKVRSRVQVICDYWQKRIEDFKRSQKLEELGRVPSRPF
jgi:hypothetical protein